MTRYFFVINIYARLFTVAVLIGVAWQLALAATLVGLAFGVVLLCFAALIAILAALLLRSVLRVLGAYGRTWIN